MTTPSVAWRRAKNRQPMGVSWTLGRPLHQAARYELPQLAMLRTQVGRALLRSAVTRSRRGQRLQVLPVTPAVHPMNRRPPKRLLTFEDRGRALHRALTHVPPRPADPAKYLAQIPPKAAQWNADVQPPLRTSWNRRQPLHQSAIREAPYLMWWTRERPPFAHLLLMPSMPRRSAARLEQMLHPQPLRPLLRSDVTCGHRRQKLRVLPTTPASENCGRALRRALTHAPPRPTNTARQLAQIPPNAARWSAEVPQPLPTSKNRGHPLHQAAINALPHQTL